MVAWVAVCILANRMRLFLGKGLPQASVAPTQASPHPMVFSLSPFPISPMAHPSSLSSFARLVPGAQLAAHYLSRLLHTDSYPASDSVGLTQQWYDLCSSTLQTTGPTLVPERMLTDLLHWLFFTLLRVPALLLFIPIYLLYF